MNISIIYKAEPYELPAGGRGEYTTPYLSDEWNEWRCQFEQDREGTCGLVLRHVLEDGRSKIVHRWFVAQKMDLSTYLSKWLPRFVDEISINSTLYWTAERGVEDMEEG